MVLLMLFVFGTAIGSFLNVVIYRMPRRESVVFPASHCPRCRHKLAWYDLIPVFSYLLLSGRCRYCKEPISAYYPIVEFLTGLLFVLIYYFFPVLDLVSLVYFLLIGSVLIIIFFTDLQYGIIPFQVVLVGCAGVLAYLFYTFSLYAFITHLLSAAGAFFAFLFLFLVTRGRGMGFGDVVLVTLMGFFLGFPNIAFALYIAFLTGAITSLILILIGSKHMRHDTIPFGPFLVSGTFISLFFGANILQLVSYFLPL